MQRGMMRRNTKYTDKDNMHGYCYPFTYSVIRFEGGIKSGKSRGEFNHTRLVLVVYASLPFPILDWYEAS